MIKDIAYLAWQYLRYHRLKSIVLIISIALIVYLPMGLNIVMGQSAKQLRNRAIETPLLIGSKGSPLELVLRSLYFETEEPASIPVSEMDRIDSSGLAKAIPIYSRFESRQGPIVATTLDYFDYRRLRIRDGRQIAMLGECVIGHRLAKELRVGDSILSSNEDVFDLAGEYPLKMKIVGILDYSGTPDDSAVFVDLKTAWIIEGLGHGHQNLAEPDAESSLLGKDGSNLIANASVLQYNEITPENVGSFHFHGDPKTFPITSIIALPKDQKSSALLQGRYLSSELSVQMVRPNEVMENLLSTIFTVGRYITFAILLVGVTTLATMSLVFLLSLQIRQRELITMMKIGASRWRVAAILGTEIISVFVFGSIVAIGAAALTYRFTDLATDLLIKMT